MTAHSKEPPILPVIVDEAGDTPAWLPIVGISGLVLVVIVIALRVGGTPITSTPTAEPAAAVEPAAVAE